MLLAEEIKRTR